MAMARKGLALLLGSPSDDDEGPMEGGEDPKTEAAAELMAAMKSGNASEFAAAFQVMVDACSGGEMADEELPDEDMMEG